MTMTEKLVVPDQIVRQLRGTAEMQAPCEACGLLAGRAGVVSKFYPMTNSDASPDHFSMLPAEQFAAAKDARAAGLEILAVWHSHPATPARMSAEDLRLAFTPGLIYVILSLAVTRHEELRGYKINGGTAEEVEVVVEK
jgi:[CysO sulfur-carrier protein]-S-L-cysteine hydrolase